MPDALDLARRYRETIRKIHEEKLTHPERVARDLADAVLADDTADRRASYLQSEINLMRRVMQHAGTWEQFCSDYAAYKTARHEDARLDACLEALERHGIETNSGSVDSMPTSDGGYEWTIALPLGAVEQYVAMLGERDLGGDDA